MKFIDPRQDAWRTLDGEDGPLTHPSPTGHALLTLAQWHAVRETWPDTLPTGVIVPNDADLDALAVDLPRLALVALQFPKWTDGRAYSQAFLLRARLGFEGEIRATGDVLVDMLPLLRRCGFDAVQLRADQSRQTALATLDQFPGHYQGDASGAKPVFHGLVA